MNENIKERFVASKRDKFCSLIVSAFSCSITFTPSPQT